MATNPLQRIPRPHRRRIRHQAERAAHRIFGPEIEMYRAQKQGVRRQYRRDVRSNRGTVAYTQDAISQVPLKGLTGKARKQVAAEMALSSKDVAASLPFLNAEARAARTEGLAEIRTDVIGARVDQAQDAARRYASLLGQEATFQTGQAKARTDVRKDRRERQKGLATAKRVAINLLRVGAAAPPGKVDDFPPPPWDPRVLKHYKGDEDAAWRAFEGLLAKQSDVDHEQAAAAVRALRKRAIQYDPRFLRGYQGPAAYSMYDRRP